MELRKYRRILWREPFNGKQVFKNCIERGILTESLEFTPAGEEWLERYSNLYENLEKYLEEIGAKPEEIEESLDVMVENIDIHMLELMINAHAEKKSVYKKKRMNWIRRYSTICRNVKGIR